ncbi:hypothetical protein K488DRAFT_88771 [Vararia minispora EC-137]|uniref:Uncharacterized protein n=1 Tax=Vararia minispora EC-137 TaxID=1314806 RepID=A0ACB8QCI7_9AGAM|nr:hypothetical protein K488DRAFT_88771 [Vararia minispora EC-137]
MSALEARLIGNDAGRVAIVAQLQHLLGSSFSIAEKNIRANGHKLEELTAAAEDEEAFDETLDKIIWDLQAERMTGERDVAAKRRQRPREIQSFIADVLRQHDADLEETQGDSGIPNTLETDDALNDDGQVSAVEVNTNNSSLAEGMQQTIATQRERVERVQIVFDDLGTNKT